MLDLRRGWQLVQQGERERLRGKPGLCVEAHWVEGLVNSSNSNKHSKTNSNTRNNLKIY